MKSPTYFHSRSLLWIVIMTGIVVVSTACSEDDSPSPSLSNEAEIISFSFNDFTPPVIADINLEQRLVSAVVPEGTDRSILTPTIVVSDFATVGPGSGVANVFIQDITYTVTAEDSSKKEWIIRVTE